MKGGSERRSDPRYAAHFDVRFARASDAARAFSAWSINFSSGGLCLKSNGTYSSGESLALSLTIEGQRFELEGVVAWTRGDAVGVRFVNVPGETRERLEAVARSLAAKSPPLA